MTNWPLRMYADYAVYVLVLILLMFGGIAESWELILSGFFMWLGYLIGKLTR